MAHIARAESDKSPYGSFTFSLGVAHSYATAGGSAGRVSRDNPGVIYEVTVQGLELLHPIRHLSAPSPLETGEEEALPLPIHHDGSCDLILGIASPTHHGRFLDASPLCLPGTESERLTPRVEDDLRATVFALRDSEVLVCGQMAQECVTAVYLVRDPKSTVLHRLSRDETWLGDPLADAG